MTALQVNPETLERQKKLEWATSEIKDSNIFPQIFVVPTFANCGRMWATSPLKQKKLEAQQ